MRYTYQFSNVYKFSTINFSSVPVEFLIAPLICKYFFFFSSRRRHTRFKCDWSSDVCSSDLRRRRRPPRCAEAPASPALDRPRPGDGRRTGGRFLANLGRNAVGVFSSDTLAPFLVSTAASGGGAFFDDNVQNYFAARRRAKWLGDFGDQLGQAYVIGPLAAGLFGAGRLARDQRFRDATYDIAQVTLVAVTYTTALKYATQRPRPDGSDKLSFPSGHTSNALAWATVGAHYYGWKLGVPGYLVAGMIGVARMEKRAHHLSDVLA